MPLHTYKCPDDSCTHTEELLIGRSDDVVEEKCPEHGVVLVRAAEIELTVYRPERLRGVRLSDGSVVKSSRRTI